MKVTAVEEIRLGENERKKHEKKEIQKCTKFDEK
jgi:hypothetical protein